MSSEEYYDKDDMATHDNNFLQAAQLQFNSRKAKGDILPPVGGGYLSNDLMNLRRLHVEDMLHQHDGDTKIHFRVFISKDEGTQRWKDATRIYNSQRRNKQLDLGVQKRTIMGKEYFELYAELQTNDIHAQIKDGKLSRDSITTLYNDDKQGFKMQFIGLKNTTMSFQWKDMVDYAEDLLIFGKPPKSLRLYSHLFNDKASLSYIHAILRQFALETRGDALAANSLAMAYFQKISIVTSENLDIMAEKKMKELIKSMTLLGKDKTTFFKEVDKAFEDDFTTVAASF